MENIKKVFYRSGILAVLRVIYHFFRVTNLMFSHYGAVLHFILKKRGIIGLFRYLRVRYLVKEVEGGIFDPLYRIYPNLAPYPRWIELEPTTICDKKCTICEHTYWKEKPQSMPFEKFKQIIDNFPKLIWCGPTGQGSSFLNKDFLKMIRHLKSKNVFVDFVDTFESIEGDIANELIELGVERIWTSFDGANKETYEKVKVGCSFEKVVKNIKEFIRLKEQKGSPLPEICFSYVITKLNVDQIISFLELVHSFSDKHCHVELRGLMEFDNIKDLIAEVPKDLMQKVEKKAKDLNLFIEWVHPSHVSRPPIANCSSWTVPYFLVDGTVQPCCSVLQACERNFVRDHKLGNIFEKPFKGIWYSEKYKKFRNRVPRFYGDIPEPCNLCRTFDLCLRERGNG